MCIPNKNIKVRPYEPPWLTTFLKRKIRQRKRAYKKAKRIHLENHWSAFKILRNEVTDLIMTSKKQYFDGIAEKLKSKSLSPEDWWATLKSLLHPHSPQISLLLNPMVMLLLTSMRKPMPLIHIFKDRPSLTTQTLSSLNCRRPRTTRS